VIRRLLDSFSSDPDGLQKLVGITILAASLVVDSLDLLIYHFAKGQSLISSFLSFEVVSVFVTGACGAVSFLILNRATKFFQIGIFIVSACLSALSNRSSGNLTSGIFLIFALTLMNEYRLGPIGTRILGIATAVLFPLSVYSGYRKNSSGFVFQTLLVIVGIAIILLLFVAVLLRHEYRHRQDKELLESRVRERTRELETSLVERTVMLDEIHHRVKNNLQLVISLLSLEAGRLEGGPARAPLEASMRQIYAMALVHDTLYRSDRLDEIDLADYSAKLLEALKSFPAVDYGLRATGPIVVKLEYAVTFGLLLNELVTEAIDAWVPSGTDQAAVGEVSIARVEDGGILLSVETRGAIARRSAVTIDRDPAIVSALLEQLRGRIERGGASGELVKVYLGAQHIPNSPDSVP
jgi:two-component sensor histidine kinase